MWLKVRRKYSVVHLLPSPPTIHRNKKNYPSFLELTFKVQALGTMEQLFSLSPKKVNVHVRLYAVLDADISRNTTSTIFAI